MSKTHAGVRILDPLTYVKAASARGYLTVACTNRVQRRKHWRDTFLRVSFIAAQKSVFWSYLDDRTHGRVVE